MTDKKFVIESIKMDLYRVVTAAGNINNELPKQSINEFMQHAVKDFDKVELNEHERMLRQQLIDLITGLNFIKDPLERLRWTEKVLTVRCRLQS
jgi:hypothetical protein